MANGLSFVDTSPKPVSETTGQLKSERERRYTQEIRRTEIAPGNEEKRNFISKRMGGIVAKLIRAEAELEEMRKKYNEANYDKLTGLPTRDAVEAKLDDDPKYSEYIKDGKMAVVFFDANKLKCINDKFGHCVGDVYLRGIADFLQSIFRKETDLIARWGGDEFVVFCPNNGLDNTEFLEKLNSKIKDELEKAKDIRIEYNTIGKNSEPISGELNIDIAVGVVMHNSENGNISNTVHLADQEMYKDKHKNDAENKDSSAAA